VGVYVARTARTTQQPVSKDPVDHPFKVAKLLDAGMGHVAGLSHWYRHTGTGGWKYLRLPRPTALSFLSMVKSGAASSLEMRLRVKR